MQTFPTPLRETLFTPYCPQSADKKEVYSLFSGTRQSASGHADYTCAAELLCRYRHLALLGLADGLYDFLDANICLCAGLRAHPRRSRLVPVPRLQQRLGPTLNEESKHKAELMQQPMC